ncbi:MAG: RNA polymerase sigma factor [Steroidobacteraceae bacterium]
MRMGMSRAIRPRGRNRRNRGGYRDVDRSLARIRTGGISRPRCSNVSPARGPSVNVRSVDAPLNGVGGSGSSGDVTCAPESQNRAQALAEVARQQHAPLVRFLTQRTGSVEDAKEIAQDAYVKVLAVERQGSIASLASYLWRSALNLMTDHGRRRVVRERFAQAARAEAEQLAPSAETVVDARQRLELIERAVGQLPPRCLHAFILRVVQGQPFDEVGRAMGISGRMAKIYVARALAHLHGSLEESEDRGGHR